MTTTLNSSYEFGGIVYRTQRDAAREEFLQWVSAGTGRWPDGVTVRDAVDEYARDCQSRQWLDTHVASAGVIRAAQDALASSTGGEP